MPPDDGRADLRPGGGHQPFPALAADGSIVDRFAAIVRRDPDRVAVEGDGTRLTYAALDRRTAAVAAAATSGVRQPGCVALLLPQGTGFVVAMVAALRTGAMVVPLDPTDPDAALVGLLEHAGASVILADATSRATARRIAGGRAVVDVDLPDDRRAGRWRDPVIHPDDAATLFYTSGSTGRPKGVVGTHADVLDNVRRYVDSLAIGSDDRLSLVHGPTFSGLVSSLFSALLTGASVHPYDMRRHGLEHLGAWVAGQGLSMIHCVPSVFRAIVRAPVQLPAMRVVRLEGDLAGWSDVDAFRGRFGPGTVLVNGLGATETGLTRQFFVSSARPRPGVGVLPVGYAVPGITVDVVDANGRGVTPGETGEIVVRGRHLARGYWGDDERTSRAFRPDPDDPAGRSYRTGDVGRVESDGRLTILGRLDDVRKVRGQTVDPTTVEAALVAEPSVAEAVVTTQVDGAGEVRLVAHVVGAAGATIDPVALRRSLAQTLPASLVPGAIIPLAALPRTAAGKLDRPSLPAPGRGRPPLATAYAPPRDPLEERLVDAWSRAIDIRPVGIDDDFFDLGGDSLSAATMLLDVGSTLGVEVPTGVLGRASTVAGLADALRRPESLIPEADDLVTLAQDDGPTLFALHGVGGHPLFYAPLARALGPGVTVHSLQPRDEAARTVYEPVDVTAERYARRIRAAQPTGPYHLVGFCYAGVVAMEVARRLLAEGGEVATLVMLSISPLEFPTLIDPAARRRFARSRARQRWRNLATEIAIGGWRGGVRAVTARARVLAQRVAYRRAVVAEATDRRPPDSAAVRAAAIAVHRPRPYPGRVVVVVGREARPPFLRDPAHDLRRLATRGVEVVVLPGDDHAMLRAPVVDRLAADLGRRIRASDGRPETPVP